MIKVCVLRLQKCFSNRDEIRVLVREINVVTSTLRWIQDDEVAHRLLTERRTFAGCFVVEPEYGLLYAFQLKRIIYKGLIMTKNFAFSITTNTIH